MNELPGTPDPLSKSQRKRDMDALQAIGEELTQLNEQQLATVDLPESLRDAVLAARAMKRNEARRRQMQYVGKLMRQVDPAPIRAKLDGWRSASGEHVAQLHRIERWRERLLAEPEALALFVADHPAADIQQLRTLIRNTAQERERGKPPKHFRALFQMIRELVAAKDAGAPSPPTPLPEGEGRYQP
ncbi:MAG: ribosome biogenesis factor YjgA [Burkholderiales bacterium]